MRRIENYILAQGDYKVEVIENHLTSSLVADFENDNKIARFTVWDDMSCLLEIMDVNTGKYIVNDRVQFSETGQIMSYFVNFDFFCHC
ncbi:hypothetical protein JHU04_001110 [Brenneria sp. 4F2]|nr:hypothetical protein [Brenneria bubanii]